MNQEDVDKREEIRKQDCGVQSYFAFKFLELGSTFGAMVAGNNLHKSVRFECEKNSITVIGSEGAPNLTARLTLSNDGRCRVIINGQEYELWQFRKMALESLFFESY